MRTAIEIKEPREYKGFVIEPWHGKFEHYPDKPLLLIASFIVHADDFSCVFAFLVKYLDIVAKKVSDEELLEKTQETIRSYVDGGKVKNPKEYTFEFKSPDFVEVKDPTWWIKSIS
jgi:hypothetical protein